MSKLTVSEWVTLDGVFDADTMSHWYDPYHSDARGAYIQERIMEADAFLMGKTTYQMLGGYWSTLQNNEFGIADKMNQAPKYVVSSTLQQGEWNNSTIIQDNVVETIARLKAEGQNLLIMGSATLVQSLMASNLIDEYRFLVHPVVMGNGKRFFTEGMDMTKLQLVSSEALGRGVLSLCYHPAP